jgi:hypothetical protein
MADVDLFSDITDSDVLSATQLIESSLFQPNGYSVISDAELGPNVDNRSDNEFSEISDEDLLKASSETVAEEAKQSNAVARSFRSPVSSDRIASIIGEKFAKKTVDKSTWAVTLFGQWRANRNVRCLMNALDSCDGHGTAVHSESRDRALTSSVNARSRDSECTAVPWPSPDGAFILAFIITAPSPSGGRGHELTILDYTPASDYSPTVETMVNKCCAFGCKSGYDSQTTATDVAFHSFPTDPELREKWIRANPRKAFKPTKNSKICSLHFQPCDFVEGRSDTNKSRLNSKSPKRMRRYLKPGAVPTVFAHAPSYLSKPASVQRSTSKAISCSRRESERKRLQDMEDSFMADDDVSVLSLDEIAAKVKAETAAQQGFIIHKCNQSLLLYLLETADNIPTIQGCIALQSDLSVVCSLYGHIVHASQYSDLVTGTLSQLSQLVNLMARVKSWITDSSTHSMSLDIHSAISCLNNALTNLSDTEDREQYRKHRKIKKLQSASNA